jgi:hypothetical protein
VRSLRANFRVGIRRVGCSLRRRRIVGHQSLMRLAGPMPLEELIRPGAPGSSSSVS